MPIQKVNGANINEVSTQSQGPAFIVATIGSKDYLEATTQALQSYGSAQHGKYTQGARDTYKNIESNISVRDQYRRRDYDYFRSSESIPVKRAEILKACMSAYRHIGLIKNVIDLMSDFGSQGVRIVHPNKSHQRFYRSWFRKVHGIERTERALNYLYKCGVFIAKRHVAKLNFKEERRLRTAKLSDDVPMEKSIDIEKRRIPIRYVFLNPLIVDTMGGDLGTFVGQHVYILNISSTLARLINYPTVETKFLLQNLPSDIYQAIKKGHRNILLDPEKISIKHYKKDDWEVWADPLIYAILDDLNDLEKMKMADRAALDSVISQIRLWKLGDLDKGLFPTAAAVNRLLSILLSNPGGGAFDIVWGPELSFEETSTDVHEFLGDEKYIPVMNRLYAGLGVPPTLTGAATASGFTNNYISLQTLIKRLEYGRSQIMSFWEQEIELVRQAMNFQRGARIEFDHQILTDEASLKGLLIQLADRDIISVDTLAERFGEDPEIEQLKINREKAARKRGLMNDKAGPWHSPEKIHEYIKSVLPRGYLGLNLPNDDYPYIVDEDTPFETQMINKRNRLQENKDKKNKGGGGRPVGSKDSVQRQRNPKPLGNAVSQQTTDFLAACLWGKQAQEKISHILTPILLKYYKKNNQRELSQSEVDNVEMAKFAILSRWPIFTDITQSGIVNLLHEYKLGVEKLCMQIYERFCAGMFSSIKKEPNIIEKRMLQVYTCAFVYLNGGNNGND